MRSPHASIWLGLREGPRLLDLHLDKALPHQPCRSQGDWLDVCSLPPPSASAETWQHSSPCGKPLLCLNLVLVVLTLSNPSSSLSLCCKPTALCTGVMDHAGCLQTPFSPMPFFCEFACNNWEPLWRNQTLDCTWQLRAVLLRWGCYLAQKMEFILLKLVVMRRMVTLAWAADGFFRKTFWECVQVSPFMWCMCILAADLD